MPDHADIAVRNEGVGLALDKKATKAWKEAGEAGEVWKAVNSRIITARLRIAKRGQRRHGMPRETSNSYATIVSEYAPTAKATPGSKSHLLAALQDIPDKIAPSLLLGDLNAYVGSLGSEEDNWQGTLGEHGVGERNQAREDLLEFCTTNQLTIVNTWFKKKPCHLEMC